VNAVTKIKPAETVTNPDVTPADPLARLREPFPAHQVSKLPKEAKRQREEREADRSKGVNCTICGGWHHRNAVHLDYVGHAALTDRLLDVDPHWSWEPVAFAPEGLPAFDRNGGLWIRLTVCGVTRLGYGNADGKSGGDAVKEIIGDALRNAAMRFGAALDLWHKGDLHAESDDEPRPSMAEMAINLLRGCGSPELFKDAWAKNFEGWKKAMSPEDYTRVQTVKAEVVAKFVREAEEAKAREAQAKPRADDPFGDVPPLDVLEGDTIPF
jgi:hypothetical protein